MGKNIKKLIFVTSEEAKEDIEKKLSEGGASDSQEVGLWVRTPDDPGEEEMVHHSRLCSCNSVCRILIEEDDNEE